MPKKQTKEKITLEKWIRLQGAYEKSMRIRGCTEMDIERSCFYCRDTSQCDQTCFYVSEVNHE